eukprot:CAMPEP_0206633762 /NCGR_PEP_ID=MMETSP0325_2-20121206/69668_1 /ASSEMBLY_ACC=CAM_ASM_000347 /TAXON_ID=2866 /ORGANISM="Crypthecodinium cohnii, Strain Seligo" /LENGTH=576 /DNA_ID=CAMNT_0054159487 /DNA_START=193 /DNA_END=1920 /DNA_ORIENTATION=-
MTFWGAQVKAGGFAKVDAVPGTILHLSEACLDTTDAKDVAKIIIESNKVEYAIAVLREGHDRCSMDLFIDPTTAKVKVTGKGTVHLTGYFEVEDEDSEEDDDMKPTKLEKKAAMAAAKAGEDDDDEEDEEEESEEDEEEEEEKGPAPKAAKAASPKASPKAAPAKAAAAADDDDDDEEGEEEESEEDEDEEEEEEKPGNKKAAAPTKKAAAAASDDDDDDDEEDESEASGDGLLPDGDGPLPYPSSDEESEMGDGQGSESENSEAAFARQFEGGDSNVEAAVNNLDQPGRDDDNNQNDNNESEDLTEYLLIPELTDEAGNVVRPLAAVAEAQRASEQRFGNTLLFVGMRPRNRGGFLLEPVSRGSFQRGGTLLLGASSCGVEALTSQGLDMDDFEVRFYCLDPEACRQDLHRQLNFIKAECANLDERPLGSLMFTCAGRAEEFFGQNYADLRMFQEEFDLPTMGFWAGGEIGPQAMAEAIPEEATRSGRAMFQGFTAVFGIFRAPLPVRKGALETLGEHQLPQAVGEVLANWAREARRRGDAGRRDGDSKTVCARQWSRAAALASVETAMAILPPT